MKRTRKSSTPSMRLFENRVMKFLHCTNEKGELHLATRKFLSTQGTSEGEGGGLSIGETTRASFSVETFDSVGKRAKMQRSSSRTLIERCLAMRWKVFIVTLLSSPPPPTLRPFFANNALYRRRRRRKRRNLIG